MALPPFLMYLLALSLLVLSGVECAAQAPDFQPLQPDKVEWADQVGRHAKVRKDSNLLAEYHFLYGKIYSAAGNHLMAKRRFLQSLRIQERRGYALALVRLYGQLAALESSQLNHAEALRYARLGLQIAERSKLDQALLRAYGMMSILYSYRAPADTLIAVDSPRPLHDSALYYLHKTEPIARRIGKPFDLLALDRMLGGEMHRRKDRRALTYLEEALAIGIKINKPYEQVFSMLSLASAYLTFGQHKEAYGLIKRAEEIHGTLPHENRDIVRGLEDLYSKYYQAKGNWKAALEHTQKLHELARENLLADREGAVTRLGIEYETEKKEAQLASQRKELALQNENLQTRNWLLFAISTLLLLAVGAIAVYYRLFRQKERLSRQNMELVQEQNHRVKNNLQVVSGLLQLQANRLHDQVALAALEDTQARLKVMAALQIKLYEKDRLTPVKAKEFVRELVDMALKSFGCHGVVPNYDIPDAIELIPDHALPVGLIVNELTTNACKYAFADHPDPALMVKMWQHNDELHLLLADNGSGIKVPLPGKGTRQSLGMKIIDLQVRQLKGKSDFDTTAGTLFQMHFKV